MADPLRILFVEDVPSDVELEQRELSRAGLRFEGRVVDAREGFLAALRDEVPDIVLCDFELPAFDGLTAVALLQETAPHTPIIIVTGSVNEETAVACLHAGASDYVLKEHLGRLPNAVVRAIDHARLRAADAAAADRLRAEHSRLRGIIESTCEPIFALDREGRYTIYNAAHADVMRALYGAEIAEGGRLLDFMTVEADRQAAAVNVRRGLAGEAFVVQAHSGVAPGRRLFEIAHNPVRGEDRVVTGLAIMARDVTLLDHAQDRVRQQAELLQAIFEASPLMIGLLDAGGRPLLVNRAWERTLGRLAEAGGDVMELCYPDPDERRRARESVARCDGSWGEFRTRASDGSEIDTSWVNVRLRDGSVLGIGQDVTARRRAEARLRQLSLATEQSPAAVMITDTDGHIEYVNRQFEQVTGYAAEEVLGRSPRVLKSGETPPEQYADLWRSVLSGQVWRGRFHNRRKDGSLFWEQASISPLRDDQGRISHLVAVKEDITARQQAEDDLRAAQAQLLQSQKIEAIGRLAGGVAHDFNNLLGVILGHTELLLQGFIEDDPRRSRLEQVHKAAEKAARLTRQLLAFSRRQVLEPRVLSLTEVVADLEPMLRRLIGEDVELRTNLPPSGAWVLADPSQVEQVLLNLVVNGRDAMPQGGTLVIDVGDIDLAGASLVGRAPLVEGPYVRLAVSDTGQGMSPEVQARVFEPFFTTKPPGQGTGLGLAMVYGIVKQSGGGVFVRSVEGAGATFEVLLPRVAAGPPLSVAAGATAPRPSAVGAATILLVEDDAALRELIEEMLEGCGYRVLAASGAQVALELAARPGAIDLVLSDVIMPGVSGRQVVEALREGRPGLRVLFMSGYTDDAISRHGVLEPGLLFIHKPFTEAALIQAVEEALGR